MLHHQPQKKQYPGGNRVEFATLTPGFTLDEPLEHLGETLALPPFLEPKRTAIEANLYKDM
jgi:glyoxalase family protein